ncbi:MAG TPA: GPW/gp25 family protein [Kineosporiaceae bacterium]|nr:GPW/gp25 family protein [Kineosporiaceae bacterium]
MGMEFVGSGIAFPLRTDASGGVALVSREREIEEAIRLVLATSPGERPMRPEFGSRIAEHVFGPANAATAGQLAYEVRVALERWEPRIDVEDVEVGFDAVDAGVLYLDVRYRIRGTNDPRNLVFPFYVIPEHPVARYPMIDAPLDVLTSGAGGDLTAVAASAAVVPSPSGNGGR